MRAVVACAILGVALPLAAGGGAARERSAGPPAGLSTHGRVLWNFEALLHKTFGNQSPLCVNRPDHFSANFHSVCGSLAEDSLYWYVFASAHGSAFHVSSKKVGGFGNYPAPVLIRRHSIACDVRETRFLIEYRSTIFTLECMNPGWVR